jgi:hypothetical protein
VGVEVLGRRVVGVERRGEDHADVALGQQQRPPALQPCFRATLAHDLEPERGAVVEGRLPCVPDVQLDVVNP